MTKGEIVARATEQFVREGCRRVTMDDIASELHVSKRTLYELFGDKKQLLEEVLTGIKERKMEQMEQYREMMHRMGKSELHSMLFTMSNYKQFISDYFLLIEDVRRTYPDLMAKLFLPNEMALEKELGNCLNEMEKAGYLRDGVNKELAAWILSQFVVKPLNNRERTFDSNTSVACEASLTYIRGLLRTDYLAEYEAQEPEIRELFRQFESR